MSIARALRRDEPEIERRRVGAWPRLKVWARRQRRVPVSVDGSGFDLLTGRVRTYASEGQAPVPHEWQARGHLSAMGGVTMAGNIDVPVRQEPLDGLHTIEFLEHLIRHVGPRLLVIWDGSPIHRRAEDTEFSAGATGRGAPVERWPPYAPDPGPTEGVWQHLEHVEMRDLACLGHEELHLELPLAIGRLRQERRLIRSFVKGAGLEVENFPSRSSNVSGGWLE